MGWAGNFLELPTLPKALLVDHVTYQALKQEACTCPVIFLFHFLES